MGGMRMKRVGFWPLRAVLLLALVGGVLGAGSGPSFLETPTTTLSGVLLFFLVLSMAFERGTHFLIAYFKKHNRHGLAAAVSNLVMELTLVGLVSLILLTLQNTMNSICVPYSGSTYESWILLGNVRGCDCCLADTSQVGKCFQAARNCGVDFCNCNGVDTCSAEGAVHRLLLGGSSASVDAEAACQGESVLEEDLDTCPEGKVPLVSLNALHQIHLFIFTVAVSHVLNGLVMILLASWRVSIWRRWTEEEDCHAQEVRFRLEAQRAMVSRRPRFAPFRFVGKLRSGRRAFSTPLSAPSGSLGSQRSRFASWWSRHTGSGPASDVEGLEAGGGGTPLGSSARRAPGGEGDAAPTLVGGTRSSPSRPAADTSVAGAGPQLPTIPSEEFLAKGTPGSSNEASAVAQDPLAAAAGAAGAPDQPAPDQPAPDQPFPDADKSPPDSDGKDISRHSSGVGAERPEDEPAPAPASAAAPAKGVPTAAIRVDSRGSSKRGETAAEDEASSFHHITIACPSEPRLDCPPLFSPEGKAGRRRLLGRTGTIKTRRGWVREWCICSLQQLLPNPVSREDFSIMRASFLLTHRVPASFDFLDYITRSMEDDYSSVVGVSFVMWLTMLVFVLVSGLIGWPVLIFLLMAAGIQVMVDTKLVQIKRHVCRGGRVNQLASNIFWFQKPSLLLVPIKFILFFCSFIFGTTTWFAVVFGSKSCPLEGSGFYFPTAWTGMPWWIYLILTGIIFFNVSFKTLPLYSLDVQMGSDFKQHMLPRGVREKLLRIAQDIKQKRRRQLEEERRAAAEASGGVVGQAVKDAKNAVRDAAKKLARRPAQGGSGSRAQS